MYVLITGAVGSGKSTIANEIKKKYSSLKFLILSDKEFSQKYNLRFVNEKTGEYEVDLLLFSKKLLDVLKTKKNIILEGHLFCEIPKSILKKMDFVFVLNASEKLLRKRMKERNYDVLKIEENVFCSNINYFEEKLDSKNIDYLKIDVCKDLKLNFKKVNKYLKF